MVKAWSPTFTGAHSQSKGTPWPERVSAHSHSGVRLSARLTGGRMSHESPWQPQTQDEGPSVHTVTRAWNKMPAKRTVKLIKPQCSRPSTKVTCHVLSRPKGLELRPEELQQKPAWKRTGEPKRGASATAQQAKFLPAAPLFHIGTALDPSNSTAGPADKPM